MNCVNWTVAVRALCEYTAKRGDLDLRFTPSPTADEGRAGHLAVAGRRPAHYETEVAVSGTWGELTVRGRADGYDPLARRVEEIKTYRGDLHAMRENHRALHWAQVRIYGWLLCEKLGLDAIELALVYYDIGSQRETVLTETATAAALKAHFDDHCGRFLAWAREEMAHRAARDAALTALRLPFDDFRSGQRTLAESVYRAAVSGRSLLAQAPTGIGKTIGTLFPLLKACPRAGLDKIYFLTAKSSGRQVALDTLEKLAQAQVEGSAGAATAALPLRIIELVAREKSCEHPDKACHGESCPLARGFYDRLPAARSAAVAAGRLDRVALRAVALDHDVCPYYLSQELVRWSDVVVGDYNYYFDVSALLPMLGAQNGWRVGVLVDEAHNLPDRARSMYSAELAQTRLDAVRRGAPRPLASALMRVHRRWNALHADQHESYRAGDTLPAEFIAALEQACATIGDYFADHPQPHDAELERFYFDALHFARLAERFDKHSLFDITLAPPHSVRGARSKRSTLCVRNVVPAGALRPRMAQAHCVALFSGTLAPSGYYADMLGLPDETVSIDIGSPFSAAQLDVYVTHGISTRYRDREGSLAAIADLVGDQFARQPGNYLCFFSSYDYLERAAHAFASRYPHVPVWQQSRTMDEAAQQAFIARFVPDGCGVGFAVLGGAFGEGIDLPGTRLIGTFIATLGLPQVNDVNEQMRERMQQLYGAGFDYAYLIPGLRKVVQAAGRVIRTPEDRGVVYLLDDRFARADVRALLPAWWHVQTWSVKASRATGATGATLQP